MSRAVWALAALVLVGCGTEYPEHPEYLDTSMLPEDESYGWMVPDTGRPNVQVYCDGSLSEEERRQPTVMGDDWSPYVAIQCNAFVGYVAVYTYTEPPPAPDVEE